MEPACEICASREFTFLFHKHGCRYEQCAECRLIRVFPQPSDQALAAIYQQNYFQAWGDGEDDYRSLKLRTFSQYIDLIPKRLHGGKLLDLGAATGLLMELAERHGYDVYGVELSEDGARAIVEKFGAHKLICRDLNGISPCAGKDERYYDVVVMSDLLEHLREPNGVLEKVRRLIRAGGALLLGAPDTSSLSLKLLGKRWNYFCPEHLFHFSKDNIHRLLQKHGIQVVTIRQLPKFLSVKYGYCMMRHKTAGLPASKLLAAVMNCLPNRLLTAPVKLKVGQFCCLAIKS